MKNKFYINFYTLSVYSFNGFILTFPLSVTVSQSFAVLSALSFIIDSFQKKQIWKRLRNRFFLSAILIYLALFLSFLANLFHYEKPFKTLTRTEFSDFWMCFVLLTGHYLARSEENLKIFSRVFFISAILSLITGLVSVFTPFRLSIFLQNFFSVPENSRMQHYAGELFGIPTYLPIGLMNTHLTFGGILGIVFVGLVANFFYKIQTRPFYRNLLHSVVIFLYGFVLFYNQSRSIWIGIGFCLFLLGFRFFSTWKKVFNKERLAILIPVMALIIGFSVYIFQKNWLIQRAFKESLRDTTTENQRFFIYRNTLPIIIHYPLFGVGVGNFSKFHLEYSQKLAEQHEELWYDLSVTPRGHAHHDPIHLWSIGGIFTLLAFFYFWYHALRFFYEMEVKGTELLFSGFMLLLPAGFFQCYFLDDEVVLPFFAFLGIFSGRVYQIKERIREKQEIFELLQERKYQAGHTFQEEAITFRNTLENFSKWFQKIITIE
ncbi:MAG: O-antigen ligase family protein, partial [Leptospiraceae bacterium]|nr:O-antigen ligase family protein [Leptospiraceae bacterium]